MSNSSLILTFLFCNFRHLLLSCVSLGMANNRNQLHMVSNKTLMSVQQKRLDINVKKLTDEAIKELFKMGALHIPESNTSQDPLGNVSINLETTVRHHVYFFM